MMLYWKKTKANAVWRTNIEYIRSAHLSYRVRVSYGGRTAFCPAVPHTRTKLHHQYLNIMQPHIKPIMYVINGNQVTDSCHNMHACLRNRRIQCHTWQNITMPEIKHLFLFISHLSTYGTDSIRNNLAQFFLIR